MLVKHAYTRGRMRRASGAVDLIQVYSGVAYASAQTSFAISTSRASLIH
jgi:hypothetical protein